MRRGDLNFYHERCVTMSIPQKKLSELLQLILHISHADCITRHSLQSLLGLMSYITACLCPARIFMTALLNGLSGIPCHATLTITDDIELTWSGGYTSFQSTMASPSFHPLYMILTLWLQMLASQVVVVTLDMSALMLIFLPTSS